LPLEGFIRRYQPEPAISLRAESPMDSSKNKPTDPSVNGRGVTVGAPNKLAAEGVSSETANGSWSTGAPAKRRKGFGCVAQSRPCGPLA